MVVALLSLLATVSLLQLQRARIVTYEQLAITSLRHIAKTCQLYYIASSGYPPNLSALGAPASNPPYLDAGFAQDPATKQGYTFTYTQGVGGSSFTLLADPQHPGVTGTRHFYVDQDDAIHVNPSGPANRGDPVLP